MSEMPEFKKVEEQSRQYFYPDGQTIYITGITEIAVSKSGNHRITTRTNDKYIVTPGWRYIKFNAPRWSF